MHGKRGKKPDTQKNTVFDNKLHNEVAAYSQCRIAARAECAIAQGPVGPPTSVYLNESVARKPEWTSNILLSLCTLL